MKERVVDSICVTPSGTIIFNKDGKSEILLPNKLTIIVDKQEVHIDTIIPLIQEYLRT